MNYGELKTFVLADAHRTDLSEDGDTGAAGFIRRGEGLIRRDLVGYELSATLDEDDRSANGVYTLPSGVAVIRSVTGTYSGDEYGLTDVGAKRIKGIPDDVTPVWYAIFGSSIEFRGVPATDAAFVVRYFGLPTALADDGDENDLLTDHEELYVAAAQFYLYQYAQDRELANDCYSRFETAIEKLNDFVARRTGGGGNAGPYNLGNFSVGSGY